MRWRIAGPNGQIVAESARRPGSGRERRKGLLGTTSLEPGEGLILDRAFQIHTFGMRYPIDVIFCTKDWRVVHVVRSMRPHRLSRFVLRGHHAIEVPAGTADVGRGDRLEVTAS